MLLLADTRFPKLLGDVLARFLISRPRIELWFVFFSKFLWGGWQLLVYGSGTVLPSTLEVLKNPGLVYSLQVGLSTLTPTGRVAIVTRKQFCTDVAGNLYQRNSNSSVVVHYGTHIHHPFEILLFLYIWLHRMSFFRSCNTGTFSLFDTTHS